MRRSVSTSQSMGSQDPSHIDGDASPMDSPSKFRAEESSRPFRSAGCTITRVVVVAIVIAACTLCLLVGRTLFHPPSQEKRELLKTVHYQDRLYCFQHLNDGNWHKVTTCQGDIEPNCPKMQLKPAFCGYSQFSRLGEFSPETVEDKSGLSEWNWGAQAREKCCFTRFDVHEATTALRREKMRRITVVGDSSGRFVYASLVRLLLPHVAFSFEKHSDIVYTSRSGLLPPLKRLKFHWAPFLSNVTEKVQHLMQSRGPPSKVVVGFLTMVVTVHLEDNVESIRSKSGSLGTENTDSEFRPVGYATRPQQRKARTPDRLDLSHARSNRHYHTARNRFLENAKTLTSVMRRYMAMNTSNQCFWISLSTIVDDKLLTEEKRRYMSADLSQAYNDMVRQSGLLQLLWPVEGDPMGPCFPLHLHQVSKLCGRQCTADGIHYTNSTYDVVSQIMLNKVRIS